MVGLFKAFLSPLLFVAFAAAEINITVTSPSPNRWWVNGGDNVIEWVCNPTQVKQFTILLNQAGSAAAQAIIAIAQNADCSKTITKEQSNPPPGTNYTIILADALNNSNIYGISQPFEVKPLGSAYPDQGSSSSSAGGSGSSTASSSSASASSSNAATLCLHSPSFLGLTSIMGLLGVGLLGA